MAGENWTFWLQMTNLAMGVIVLLAVVPVVGSVVREIMENVPARCTSSTLTRNCARCSFLAPIPCQSLS